MIKILSSLREQLKRMVGNNAFMTLFATTLGVLLAFYLNNLAELRNETRKVNRAFSNIIEELESNKNHLELGNINDSALVALDGIRKYDPLLNGEIIATSDSIDSIFDEIKIAQVLDSIDFGNNLKKYFVNYSKIEFGISTLPNVAWEAAQMAAVTNEFDYNCLTAIIETYDMQNLYETEARRLLEFYLKEKYSQMYLGLAVTKHLRNELILQYEKALTVIRNCN